MHNIIERNQFNFKYLPLKFNIEDSYHQVTETFIKSKSKVKENLADNYFGYFSN